ncbi:MAG TPA: hypothetical protein VL918_08190 [Sphingobium sp.]|nr:hypothetical protein [Sphingobium sp.]
MTEADSSPAENTPAAAPEDKKEGAASAKSNAIWMGTAVGIGSAALVAALMYARRRK